MRTDFDGFIHHRLEDGPPLCSFGISEVIGGLALSAGIGATASAAIGAAGAGLLGGAALGAGEAALTGGNIGKGALFGAVGGGLTGGLGSAFGGSLAGAMGTSVPVADAAIGGVTNAALGAVSSKNPLQGALMGGLSGAAGGYAAGALGGLGGSGVPGGAGDNVDVLGNSIGGGPDAVDIQGNPIPVGPNDGATAANWGVADPNAPSISPLAGNSASVASGGSGGGGGSGSSGGLGGLFGGKINNTSLLLGALSSVGSLLSKPQVGQYPTPGPGTGAAAQNLGALYNTPLNTNFPGRVAVNPGAPGVFTPPGTPTFPQPASSYYRYGSMPEQTFFTGNSLKNFGFARGGALHLAHAPEFSTGGGRGYVRGEGDGTSDSVDAKLSDGEYVMDAATVSRLGMGSNEAGAKKLDQFRDWLAKQSGQKKFIPARTRGALSNLAGRAA